MMQQYYDIKVENPDSILMFRLGDFYEMFFDDAIKASEILNLVLTGRDCGLDERAPMCGVPFHSCDGYIARLVQSGCKVAICEQMEDPALAKDIVERSIIRIVTPGTVIEDTMLEEGVNNYLCSVAYLNGDFGMAISDISCGSVKTVKIEGANKENRLICELSRFAPKEVLVDLSTLSMYKKLNSTLTERISCAVTPIPGENFLSGLSAKHIFEHFKTADISTFGLSVNSPETAALDVLIKYLNDNGMSGLN
ncbi:MAG: DNA mismatch repair protein MutS, partial [Oscillospiraceae bacterium]|nr:DNA mismatch repair protein MutS [Candidatus Equicaccousia limihippi]